ncbi:MAG: hypothetical protein ACOC3V_01680 [bacterium]
MKYIYNSKNATIWIDGKEYIFKKNTAKYKKAIEFIENNDEESMKELVKLNSTFLNFEYFLKGEDIEIKEADNGDVLFLYKDYYIINLSEQKNIEEYILHCLDKNISYRNIVNFLKLLSTNPTHHVKKRLFDFLQRSKLPITKDGCFLAYKKINNGWKDCHTNTISNKIGEMVQMPRNQCDDDDTVTCSRGLHFCGHSYLKSFSGNIIVILKINPRNVVSIPVDYESTKGRCCEYEVFKKYSTKIELDELGNISLMEYLRIKIISLVDLEGLSKASENLMLTKKLVDSIYNDSGFLNTVDSEIKNELIRYFTKKKDQTIFDHEILMELHNEE